MRQRPQRFPWAIAAVFVVCLLCTAGCGHSGPLTIGVSSTPLSTPEVAPAILALPQAFRFEMTLRTPGARDEPATVITGQYRDGAWSQSSRRGEGAAEDLIVAPGEVGGALHTFTRPVSETVWTRWPGAGFDAAYGLSSPFSVLRLYPLADQRAAGEAVALPGVTEPLTKTQTVFTAETIQRLLRAGVAQVATEPERQSALEAQLAPLAQAQTVTYWTDARQRVHQAAATLLTGGAAGQPTPWLEVIWRFFDYDDPAIAVVAPAEFADAAALLSGAAPMPADSAEIPLDPKTTLRIRSFSVPGLPLDAATVSVYPAGARLALASHSGPDAQFALPDGKYDVEVKTDAATEWLKAVVVVGGSVVSQDVVFNFGTLNLIVTQSGAQPKVDMAIYPAGERQNFAAYSAENPAAVLVRGGVYDVEVALRDFSGSKMFTGIEVRAGETVTYTLDLAR